MRLFAELYLDEDVSVLVATLLRARGIDVTTAREEGMLQQDLSLLVASRRPPARSLVARQVTRLPNPAFQPPSSTLDIHKF